MLSTLPDLSRPSAKGLAYLLRHKELWPEGFSWDYIDPDRCAIGLARRYWPRSHLPLYGSFGLSVRQSARIFNFPLSWLFGLHTPARIANLLDKAAANVPELQN